MALVCRECGTKQESVEGSFQACRVCLSNTRMTPASGVELRWASSKKGRGIFAIAPFNRGDVIERCHAILLSPTECERIPSDFEVINRYVFPWDPGKCLLTGFGLIYNHDSKTSTGKHPNMKAKIHLGSLTVEFCADRSIRVGEELTYDYRGILFLGGAP